MAAISDTNPPFSHTAASIADVVAGEGGRVTFARFMELALTHPTLGYYSRVQNLLGRRGDFSTAPYLSPFFNETVARLVTELLDASLQNAGLFGEVSTAERPTAQGLMRERSDVKLGIVELGGGDGHLAAAILSYVEQARPHWREMISYHVLERSTGLREAQASRLEPWTSAGWQVAWHEHLAEAWSHGRPVIVLANEFLDALPVHVVDVSTERAREAYVCARVDGCDEGSSETCAESEDMPALSLIWDTLSAEASAEMESLFATTDAGLLRPLTQDGILELRPAVAGLVRQVARLMPAGSLLNIDYGDVLPGIVGNDSHAPAATLSADDRIRRHRSLRGYYKHQLIADPLARPGLQDLTADVDFAALDLAGRQAGFETVLFTTLSHFLRAGGAQEELRRLAERRSESDGAADGRAGQPSLGSERPRSGMDALEADRQATALRGLLDERDLGSAFKLMLQVRG